MRFKEYPESSLLKPSVIFTGTAEEGAVGPPLGLVDIGVAESGYLFRVALPGVRCRNCNLKFDIQLDGRVEIEGVITESEFLKTTSKVYEMKNQQLCPPGPFTISFALPGPVDPRLCSPLFRADGILEVIVLKHRIPCVSPEGLFQKWEDSNFSSIDA